MEQPGLFPAELRRMGMELFLNLCWLSLLLPAYWLWRQRAWSDCATRASLVFFCTLGCVFVLLFPVISATDDLHAMRPEMEESERASRQASDSGFNHHHVGHSSQLAWIAPPRAPAAFHQIGTVFLAPLTTPISVPASASFSRPPPSVA
jgi:hypothetical protein